MIIIALVSVISFFIPTTVDGEPTLINKCTNNLDQMLNALNVQANACYVMTEIYFTFPTERDGMNMQKVGQTQLI
jgi:hypothetical protein